MNARLRKLEQTICVDLFSATFLQASVVCRSRSDSQDGPTVSQSGQAPAHVSRGASQMLLMVEGREPTTPAISGRTFIGSSKSAALQLSLESKLRMLFEKDGSTKYSRTWKRLTTPAGRSLCSGCKTRTETHLLGWPHRQRGTGRTSADRMRSWRRARGILHLWRPAYSLLGCLGRQYQRSIA